MVSSYIALHVTPGDFCLMFALEHSICIYKRRPDTIHMS
uniref:Uncharacterized protein n=1 Tax=Anguilla anguilla TaxID=7936 RepID=A0A0E9RNH9_ANGAN